MDHKTERLEGKVHCLLIHSQDLPRSTNESHDHFLPLILYFNFSSIRFANIISYSYTAQCAQPLFHCCI